jgi:methionyl aminopeptidase
MSIILKTKEEIEIIREGGKILAYVLNATAKKVVPGISTLELDQYAESLIREKGGKPAFKNYKPYGAKTPFPATLCVSINDEVVHGIPTNRILKEGDIIALDCGVNYKGYFTDMAITVGVGEISKEDKKLLEITREALMIGVKAAKIGKRVGDIGYAIESFVRKQKHNYGIVDILSGHGVGKYIHEDPFVPNFGDKNTGEKLVEGMVIAIEPMLNMGTKNVFLDKSDNWTFKTRDGKNSAHFELTIAVGKNGGEILSKE